MRGLHRNADQCPRTRGRQWEYDFFGFTREGTTPPFLDFDVAHRDALEEMKPILVREGWDQENPRPQPARKLLHEVRSMLIPSFAQRLTLVPTIGTTLDFWHGIDCIIAHQDHPDLQVTIDICTYRKPKYKADALVTRDKFLHRLSETSQLISGIMWAKYRNLL